MCEAPGCLAINCALRKLVLWLCGFVPLGKALRVGRQAGTQAPLWESADAIGTPVGVGIAQIVQSCWHSVAV